MNEADALQDIRNVLRRADLLRVAPDLVDRCDDNVVESMFFAINEALVCGHSAVEPVHLLVASFRQTPAAGSRRPGFFDVDKLCDDVLRRAHPQIPVSQEQLDLGSTLRARAVADAWERRRGTFARRVPTLPVSPRPAPGCWRGRWPWPTRPAAGATAATSSSPCWTPTA